MGGAIAERLLQGGRDMVVYDTNRAAVDRFVANGAHAAQSPKDVADQADIVVACLPTTAASEAVAIGENGVKFGQKVRVYIDTGTIGSELAMKIEAELAGSIGFIASPVSGGPPGVRANSLTTMASGARDAYEIALPVLQGFAKNVFYLGQKAHMSQLAKLINNHLSAAGRLAAFEGFVLAMKAGLDVEALLDLVNVSSGCNYTTTDKMSEAIFSGTFKFNGHLGISIKDETLLIEEAGKHEVPLWVAPRLLETLKEAAEAGYLEQDSMNVIRYMGERAAFDVAAHVATLKKSN